VFDWSMLSIVTPAKAGIMVGIVRRT